MKERPKALTKATKKKGPIRNINETVQKKTRKKKKSIKGVIVRPGAITNFLYNGFIRVTTKKILLDAMKKLKKNELKNSIATLLPLLDEKSRASILRKFWRETKPGLSPQDKVDLLMEERFARSVNLLEKRKNNPFLI